MRAEAESRTLLPAIALAIGPVVAIGFARFSYALLLPAMRRSLDLNYALAGLVNTANAAGYLVGAIVATAIASAIGARRAFLLGMLVTAASLLGSGATTNFGLLLVCRTVSGLAGAVVFVVGAALAAQLANRRPARASTILSIYTSGGGLGIVLSGLVLQPQMNWRLAWAVLGGVAILAAALVWPVLRGIQEPHRSPVLSSWRPPRALTPVFIAYGLFGLGYIAYMTFIVAFVEGRGVDGGEIRLFWIVLGLACVVAMPAWGALLDRMRGGAGIACCLGVVAVGAALPLLHAGAPFAFASAVLFGGSMMVVVSAVTSLARRMLPPSAWTSAIGQLTFVFALGQAIGPSLSGLVSDRSGGVATGLAASVVVLIAGTVVSLWQREHVGGVVENG
ncbi:MAG TPA: YbfB/YjiJ family MFS transporter [Candidatus Dormibacteraeota bacterium]|jgi:predicted MFS family arabinose efflux permease|nr:YbfB/YjiJ family MFS transporter [Candidatus Dormibacteraeota bacterium]